MALIRVVHTIELIIDTEKYIQAAIESESITEDELGPGDHSAIAYCVAQQEEEEVIPRWARNAINLTDQKTTIADTQYDKETSP